MKTKQGELQFPDCSTSSQEKMKTVLVCDPIFRVSEIEISYHPVVKPSDRLSVTCSSDAEKVFRRIWCKPIELRECFYALFLNRANKVLGYYLVSIGGISGTLVDIRTIFQAALKANTCSVIFAHCHPSGNPKPSDADLELTRKLKDAGKILEISVLDHLIILPDGYVSMADEGIFQF